MTYYRYASIRYDLITKYGEKYQFINNDYKRIVEWVSLYASFKGLTIKKDRETKGANFLFEMD